MRASEFTADAPGDLITIPGGMAYLPKPLPPELALNWDLMGANDRASRALGELTGQARIVANDALILGPLLTREAVESNRIEGTHTVVDEVLLQRAAGPPRDHVRANENLEVLRYMETATTAADVVAGGQPLNMYLLRALHEQLLSGTRGESRHPGSLRTGYVFIGQDGDRVDDARFVPPPPEQVEPAMDALVGFLQAEPPYPPLIACALMHYQFETIHPFEDGNGRLGRLLIPTYLLAHNVIDRPLLYLSEYFEAHRDDYVAHLKGVSTHGNWLSWVAFFLDAVRSQAVAALARTDSVLELASRYRERTRAGTRTQTPLAAIELIMERVYVSAPELADYAQRDYRTAKGALETLAGLGILMAVPGSYPQRWVAQELLDLVYRN